MADFHDVWRQLALAGALIAMTTLFHALVVAGAAALARALIGHAQGLWRTARDAAALTSLGLVLMAAHAVEIWMWAMAFLRLELFADFEAALYFAAVSYTTLGFGDVLLDPPWRLLSGACAANGLLLFGLSAAVLVEMTIKLRVAGPR